MNQRFSSSHRRAQPRLRLIAALISAALALAAAPALASALAAAGHDTTARAKSTATGAKPLFAAQSAPGFSLASPAASHSRWSIQPTPNPSAPNGVLLYGTCTSPSSCIGVGTHVTASKLGVTLVERWNGEKWSVQRTPNPAGATVGFFYGVGCSSRSACTAVGSAVSASGRNMTLAERWDGSRWLVESIPNPPGSRENFLIGVACPSRSACTAVGQTLTDSGALRLLVERWNGSTWRIQRAPNPTGSSLGDASCTGPSACTAVGFSNAGALAERWNGHKWSIQPTPNPPQGGGFLNGVVCTSSSSCTAVGGSNAGNLAERWNGRKWSNRPVPNPPGNQFTFLNGVGCSSRSACTAVGAYGNSSGETLTLAER
ncbi:MAG: hypothetical protein JO342_18305, partial [Solirubrobacterales bacterium]|nr:hypothetical protein [Solirubrobacterales bacterium]